ncbi:hypothetical protein ZEAMMB73_Zm00001d039364, partial [Zea mays]
RSCECDHRHVPCCILRPPTLTTVLHHLHSPVTPASEQEQTDGVSRCRQEGAGADRGGLGARGGVRPHRRPPPRGRRRHRGGRRSRNRPARPRYVRGHRRRGRQRRRLRRRLLRPRRPPRRRPRRGQPGRLRGAGGHREAPRARGRALRRHLRRAAAGAGALGPARRRQGNGSPGVRGQVPGRGGRRGRERGGRRQGRDGAWPRGGHGVRSRSRGPALRQGQGRRDRQTHDGQVRTRVRLRGTEPGSVAVQRHAQGPDTSGQRQRGDGGARDRRRAAPGQGGRRGRVGRGGRRRAPRHQDRRRRAAAGRRRPAVRPHRRTGWHAGREDDAGRQGGAHGAAEGACGGGQGVRRHWRRHGAGAGAARPHRGQHEGDDVRVQGGPAQRVREQGGGGREPGHEREHRDGHGVRAGRRGEAARPRGGAGGGGSPALRLTITGPATTYGV